jgi:pyruvate ferredoxin oxidoreductase alpha subunit
MDRSSPGGAPGMLYNEISGALYNSAKRPVVTGYVYGLGGRDMTVEYLKGIFADGLENAKAGKPTTPLQQFIGVRGPKLNFL